MDAHLGRARLLIEQSRYDLAEEELRQTLAADPENAVAHALLAFCLTERGEFDAAAREAEAARRQAPDEPFVHYALALVLQRRRRPDEAAAAVGEAIRLDPGHAGYLGMLAHIRLDQRRWIEALEAAERGLRTDPENVECLNYRAIALVKLGRREEAGATLEGALAREPENALSHANEGWRLLHAGEAARALEHFREALRLEPGHEWARQGIVEALKARSFTYGLMLRYFLWMGRLSGRAQWAVIIGGYIGYRALIYAAELHPALAPWLLPIIVAYIVFALMGWLASPLFNLALRLDRFGRLALSREQIVASNWVGACVLLALGSLGAWIAGAGDVAEFAALSFGFLLLPLTAVSQCRAGWPRRVMALYTAALLAVRGVHLTLVLAWSGKAAALDGIQEALMSVFLWGAVLSVFVAMALSRAVPRR